jgi:hypothetical protein
MGTEPGTTTTNLKRAGLRLLLSGLLSLACFALYAVAAGMVRVAP